MNKLDIVKVVAEETGLTQKEVTGVVDGFIETIIKALKKGEEVNVANSLINIGLGSVIDVGFEKVSGKIDDFMRSKMPQNYSSYACDVRKVNPGMTQNQIKSKMRRAINVNRAVYKGISYGLDFSRSFLPY